jgi:hypothetical protein
LIRPGAPSTVSVVVPTALFAVVDSLLYVESPVPAPASAWFSGPRMPPTAAPLPVYCSVVVLSEMGGVPCS